jgi:hypothetical protein
MRTASELRQIAAPIERIRAIQRAAEQAKIEYDALLGEAVRELLATGRTFSAIGRDLGLSKQRVHQIAQLGKNTVETRQEEH